MTQLPDDLLVDIDLPEETAAGAVATVQPKGYALRRLRGRKLRHLSESFRLEERADHAASKVAILTIFGALIALLTWISFAELPEVARGTGQIQPIGFERELVHPIGGVLEHLEVTTGQRVEAGQLVARFASDQQEAALRTAQRLDTTLALQEERLRAYLAGEQPNFGAINAPADEILAAQKAYRSMNEAITDRTRVLDEQLRKTANDRAILEQRLAAADAEVRSLEALLSKRENLYRQGLVVLSDVTASRRAVADAQLRLEVLREQMARSQSDAQEIAARRASLLSTDRSDNQQRVQQVTSQREEQRTRLAALEEEINRLTVLAPVAGVVKLPDRVAEGDFISGGEPIGHIVPEDDELVAQIRVLARDIRGLTLGQEVQIKVTALDFVRYGKVSGTIRKISPAAIVGDDGTVYYIVTVSLDDTSLSAGAQTYALLPGMVVDAEILNGTRTIAQYILKPVMATLDDAFKEE